MRAAFVAGAVLALGLAAGGPAYALDNSQTDHGNHDGKGPHRVEVISSSRGNTAAVGSCTAVANQSYIGVSCPKFGVSDTVTPKDILKKDPVPDCWHVALSPQELAGAGLENVPGPDGYVYYWHKCLKGIDPKTYEIQPGGIRIETEIVQVDNGDEVLTLTPRQKQLVEFYDKDDIVPSPQGVTSPRIRPRVNTDIAFVNAAPGEVLVDVGAFALRGRIVRTEVQPLGAVVPPDYPRVRPDGQPAELTTDCPGKGVAVDDGDTRQSRPRACWFTYLHSSAGQQPTSDEGQPAYPAVMTAHWVVDLVWPDGSTQQFAAFDKSATMNIAVSEIQSIVVF